MARRRPQYSPEFKAEAIRLVRTSGQSVAQIARELGVSKASLLNWAEQTRPAAAEPLTNERTELQQLRREVRRLREERDILKEWSYPRGTHVDMKVVGSAVRACRAKVDAYWCFEPGKKCT